VLWGHSLASSLQGCAPSSFSTKNHVNPP
jgi:hypothetical protein